MKTQIHILIVVLILTTLSAKAKQNISGKVTNANNEALKGVIVTTNASTTGIRTNSNGHYTITVNNRADSLIFIYPGLHNVCEPVDNRKIINVSMLKRKTAPNTEYEMISYAKVQSGVMPVYAKSANRKITGRMAASFVAPPSFYDYNTESYTAINESGFRKVSYNPLSTFSADVDNASYSNIRRFINNGELPPKDAVRIEEMMNYFNYDLSYPSDNKPIKIQTEYSECPWNKANGLLMVTVQATKIETDQLPPSNLVFLIDVSGSMRAQNKLPLVKSSLKMLVQQMRPQDKISIVTYAGSASLALDATPGTNKQKITKAIEKLSTGGGTAGGKGLEMAYRVASKNFISKGNNRIVLATDGDFNLGQSSDAEMQRMVEQQRNNGIFITALGFGMGNLKDSKLEAIANNGNGNYAYIDNSQEAHKLLIKEFGGTLFTVAKDVKFQVEFNPQFVDSYRLVGYENRKLNEEDFENDKKDAGEIGAGHQVIALYEIIPTSINNNTSKLKYQKSEYNSNSNTNKELLTVKVRYKDVDSNTSKRIEVIQANKKQEFGNSSSTLRFASAVAQFGMLLRNSEFKGDTTSKKILEVAKNSKESDYDGYKGEFIRLVETAETIGLVVQHKE